MSNIFGQIVVASQIEEAVIKTLMKWMPTYLSEICRQQGLSLNNLPHPQNYTNRNSFDASLGERLPRVVVIAPGLVSAPTQTGQGSYTAVWRVGIGVATESQDEESSNSHTKAYAAAVRGVMLQQQRLDGSLSIAQIVWLEESYEDLPFNAPHKFYKAAALFFAVDIENVVNKWKGPDVPTIEAPPAFHEVHNVIVNVVPEGV